MVNNFIYQLAQRYVRHRRVMQWVTVRKAESSLRALVTNNKSALVRYSNSIDEQVKALRARETVVLKDMRKVHVNERTRLWDAHQEALRIYDNMD